MRQLMPIDSPAKIELLEWDSNFFQLKVGRLTAKHLKKQDIIQLLETADFDLIYLIVDQEIKLTGVDKWEVSYCDHRVSLTLESDSKINTPIETEQLNENDITELQLLAEHCGVYSRFNLDPRISDECFKKLYHLYLAKGLNSKKIFVKRVDNTPAGFLTYSLKGEKMEVANIDLMVVAANFSKQGFAKELIQRMIHSIHCDRINVTTQAENIPALRLYQGLGFEIFHRERICHLWKRY